MDNLITISYFKAGIIISNLSDAKAFPVDYIAKYQKQYLIKSLGYAMYKDFETELAKEEVDIPQIWKDLRDGADYNVTVNGATTLTRWNGFINTEEVSPISNFVYYWYLRQNNTQLMGIGTGIPDKENATSVSPAQKLTSAWNDYIILTGNLKDYVNGSYYVDINRYRNNKYHGDDLSFIDDTVTLDESLFMYLYHHREDFTNWIFTNDIKINTLGI